MTYKQRIGQRLFARMPITRFLFDQLRVELNACGIWIANKLLPSRRRSLRQLRQASGLLVNVACGPRTLPGFINIDLMVNQKDILRWDCRWSLPLADNSAKGIRVEHFVEHLEPREELPAFLTDSWRALQPGGVLRVIVPDAERYLKAYCRDDLQGFLELAVPDPFPADLPTKMDVVNHVFHQWHEHRWGYDFETLAHRLSCAGFTSIKRMTYRESIDLELAKDGEEHAPYSLYVDAVK